jgi:pimeloyl-ACP methyl ester carboxylesterase
LAESDDVHDVTQSMIAAGLIDRADIDLEGGSHGGMVALLTAFRHPETYRRIHAFVPLVNPQAPPGPGQMPRMRRKNQVYFGERPILPATLLRGLSPEAKHLLNGKLRMTVRENDARCSAEHALRFVELAKETGLEIPVAILGGGHTALSQSAVEASVARHTAVNSPPRGVDARKVTRPPTRSPRRRR